MDMVNLAANSYLEKNSGLLRNAWRYARRPLFGIERAAAGATPGVGQMSAKTEKFIADQVSRQGIGREAYNKRMADWWAKNKDLVDDYMTSSPKAKGVFAKGDSSLQSIRKQFETGTGKFQGRGTLQSRIDAQKAKDLEASYAKFGPDAKRMADAERVIQAVRQSDMSAIPTTALGGAVGAYGGYQEGGIQGALAGAAAGATLGYGGGRALAASLRSPNNKAWMDAAKSVQKNIMGQHGSGQLGARLNYKGRRAADFFLEKGRYATAGERARFGRLGGAHIFGRHGEEVAARAMQGGLLGKGGLIRGALALDPRVGMNARLARHALSQGRYRDAARLGGAAALGGGMHAGKLGLMAAFPVMGVYGDLTGENPEGKSMGERLGRSLASNIATMTTFPLGAATWAPSMVLGENYGLSGQIGNLGGAIGSAIGGKGTPSLPTPALPQDAYPQQAVAQAAYPQQSVAQASYPQQAVAQAASLPPDLISQSPIT